MAAATLMMVFGRFVGPSLVVLDLAMLGGLWLMCRRARAGVVVIAVFSLANLLLHGPILVLQLTVPDAPASFVTGLFLPLSSLLALVATVGAWRHRHVSARSVSTVRRSLAGLAALTLLITGVLFATRHSDVAQPGDLALTTNGTGISQHDLVAPAGLITMAVRNEDPLFPRGFDLDEADVHVLVAPRTTRRVTFTLPAGRYVFYDNATATDATRGTLTVGP